MQYVCDPDKQILSQLEVFQSLSNFQQDNGDAEAGSGLNAIYGNLHDILIKLIIFKTVKYKHMKCISSLTDKPCTSVHLYLGL